ncbi:MAG: UvrD-helicase domain-containing protein [Hydrotalea sp.]|nr:UvrD-helicase domain-containing protein [Hydrotalea sp.]
MNDMLNTELTVRVTTRETTATSLTLAQRQAIDSDYYVWVAASAGSGKTKVLIDRVLHLLLVGHRLRDILIITFTRAAAAEIKNRLDKKLAEWTFAPDKQLAEEIKNILGGKWRDDEKNKKLSIARGLFLRMMDEKQNLTINTIHGFCQQLLNYFPLEAGVPFGFRLAEEDEAKKLRNNAIDTTLLRTDAMVAPLISEVKRYWQDASQLRQMIEKLLADRRALRNEKILGHDELAFWQKNFGWLSADEVEEQQAARQALLAQITAKDFLNKDGKTISKTKRKKFSEEDESTASAIDDIDAVLAAAESAGKNYVVLALAIKILDHYEKIKFENGLLDYDDLIIKAGDLLADEKNIHPWVQYKMAGAVKHLLLDEAQDTSPSQWRVVESLVDGFSVLQKNKGDHGFLVVGDVKQSIFGFQGADVAVYQYYKEKWQQHFASDFRALPFDISFRSGKNILQFIDKVFADKNFAASHQAHDADLPSQVIIKKFASYAKENKEEENRKNDLRDYIAGVAKDIKQQIDGGVIVARGAPRRVVAGDIMVLIRERNPLQAPLVAALKKIGVPVAGRDRITLRDEWLVKDLLNLGQFALLPRVDFYLANLLVSPLCGLSYVELEKIALGRDGTLYDSLRNHADKNRDGWWPALVAWLDNIAGAATQKNAFEFFYNILQSPCPYRYGDKSFVGSGRAMLLARWGREEAETINIFLDRLLSLEKNKINHLAAALDNLLADDSEIKKETASDQNAGVRIITCHGAKGLESPIVFLPDYIPDRSKPDMALMRADSQPPLFLSADEKKQHDGWQKQKERARAEEWRLLYVALTRAKNLLVISGFGKNQEEENTKGEATAYKNSWYYLCQRAMADLPHEIIDDTMVHGDAPIMKSAAARPTDPSAKKKTGDMDWLTKKMNLSYARPNAPADEATPQGFTNGTRPLHKNDATQKGLAVHRLLQLLTTIDKEQWQAATTKTIAKEFPAMANQQEELLAEVAGVLNHGAGLDQRGTPNLPDDWRDIFMPTADGKLFLEQEVMGMVAGAPRVGRLDRMLITPREVKILDYKTSAAAITTIAQVPASYKKQMMEYRALLQLVYPQKKIRTALLFTNGLRLIEI